MTRCSCIWRRRWRILPTIWTLAFYDCEEIAAEFNGLGHIERDLPEWLAADVAILGEPTSGLIEAEGCQGTLRVRLTAGVRAHSA